MTATTSKHRFTLAVDYGDGLERQHAWIATESAARQYFARLAPGYSGFGTVALLDGTAHVIDRREVIG
jgi:hypothetical protein